MSILSYTIDLKDAFSGKMKKIKQLTKSSLSDMANRQVKYTNTINKSTRAIDKLSQEFTSATTKRKREINAEIRQLRMQQTEMGRLIKLEATRHKNFVKSTAQRRRTGGRGIGLIGGISGGGMVGMAAGAIAVDAVQTQATFARGTSQLEALTNSQAAKTLADNAMMLGSASEFTASEVQNLEVTLVKYGFSAEEAAQSTQGLIEAASATGATLDQISSIGAATLRGFSLEAEEMSRVSDVMSLSFVRSALDVEKFRESMKYVAPVARAAGFSLEETTAMLSALADAGVSGSQAGTSLRRIFTEVAKAGGDPQVAFRKMAREGLTLTDAFDEVGRTAQTALSILSESGTKVDELTVAYQNAEGAAAQMSATMRDNLIGDVNNMKSSWERLILSIKGGDGVLRSATKLLDDVIFKTTRINELTNEGVGWNDAFEQAHNEKTTRAGVRERNEEKIRVEKAVQATGFTGTLREFLNEEWDVSKTVLRNDVRAVLKTDVTDQQNRINASINLQKAGFSRLAQQLFGQTLGEVTVNNDTAAIVPKIPIVPLIPRDPLVPVITDLTNVLEEESRITGNRGTALSRSATVKQLTISIDKIVGVESLNTTNIKESTGAIGKAVNEALVKAVTDVTSQGNFN